MDLSLRTYSSLQHLNADKTTATDLLLHFYSATYAIAHAGQIFRSGHSIGRKIALGIQVIYNCINLTFSWFAIVSDSSTSVTSQAGTLIVDLYRATFTYSL
jgi:uncharacterized protein (UPF0210 family)